MPIFTSIGLALGATAATAAATGAAVVGAGVAVAGAGYSAYSQYQAGKSAQALNNYNAQQETVNAQTAVRDANNAANSERHRNQQILGKQRAALAANGVAIDTGSPLLLEMNSAANLEMGALETERQGGIAASRGYQQAELDRMQGNVARKTGALNAGATLLQGASSALGIYTKYKGIG